jgi:hypothetical protein
MLWRDLLMFLHRLRSIAALMRTVLMITLAWYMYEMTFLFQIGEFRICKKKKSICVFRYGLHLSSIFFTGVGHGAGHVICYKRNRITVIFPRWIAPCLNAVFMSAWLYRHLDCNLITNPVNRYVVPNDYANVVLSLFLRSNHSCTSHLYYLLN